MLELNVPDLGDNYRFLLWKDGYRGDYQIEVILQKRRLSWPLKNPVWERNRREIMVFYPSSATDKDIVGELNTMINKVSVGLEKSVADKIAADRLWKMFAEFNSQQLSNKPGKSLDHA